MPDTPTIEPATLAAGDTFTFKRSWSDWPASTWTVTYYLRGPAQIDIEATADGDNHLVDETPAVTAKWNVGVYDWQAYADDGTNRFKVTEGTLEVTKDFAAGDAVYDARSVAAICVDQINQVLKDRTSEDVQSYAIGGRQMVLMSDSDLLVTRGRFMAEVAREKRAAAIARGETKSTQVKARFSR